DLDHVAGLQLLKIGLVAAGPAGRLFDEFRAEDSEDLLHAFLTDDISHTDEVAVPGRAPAHYITMRDPEAEIQSPPTFDGSLLDFLDCRCTVMWIDNSVADLETHILFKPLSRNPSLP